MNDVFVLIEHFQDKVADISYVCLAQAHEIAQKTGSKVVAVLLGENVKGLTADLLADEVLVVNHEALREFNYNSYLAAMAHIAEDKKPGIFILGDTSIGSDLAGGLSFRTGLPLVSFCKEIMFDNDLNFISQICGGKVLVRGALPEDGVIVTLLPGRYKAEKGKSGTPPKIIEYQVPGLITGDLRMVDVILPSGEDLDISKEAVLVSVGRGIENADNLSIMQELADLLGGALCASRPVVDQGWLPSTRLVGKSGKTVKPKLYLALGISGAPEHVEAIEDSELIIAVNTDPNAPIFDHAKYGTTEDLMDISEELILSVKELKGE